MEQDVLVSGLYDESKVGVQQMCTHCASFHNLTENVTT